MNKRSLRAALACEVEPTMGFIGYAARKEIAPGRDLVRIFINCEDKPPESPQAVPEPEDVRPPAGVRFLHAVDVVFERKGDCRLRGLDSLSSVRKFNRFLGSLAERAREQRQEPNSVFDSAENLLATLARVKNARDFTP